MQQHFLQTAAWESFQKSLGNTTLRRNGDGWSYMAIVEQAGGVTRLYCPYGPTVASLKALDAAIEALKADARQYKASFLRIQPVGVTLDSESASARSMRRIQYSQPEATRVIDLAPSLDDLCAAMSQTKRNIYHNYQKKGLEYHVTKDPHEIERLLPLLHDAAARNKIALHSDAYIRKQAATLMPDHASLHYMTHEGVTITAAMLFEGETVNYYAHAGTAADYHHLSANTALVGELIAYSKAAGKTTFDLYGVAPTDDPNHSWSGVTKFKAGFGGRVVLYNPTYDLPLRQARYALYQLLRTVRRAIR